MSGQRQTRRVTVSVDVVLGAEGAHYFAQTGDLSQTGLFLRTTRAFPIGTRLRLVFGQPPALPRVEAEGVVRWCSAGEGVGIEFTRVTPEDKESISRFLGVTFQ